ncbi:shikimate kinase [Motilibacter rhizosphaerae]|uniref:Shikimate kinase n=1 Tax=Motilibacter rhizosphaerae TaxID=598652 RepID=A0A4Q7NRE4_9ACTN|nr:shikimate kinase [Motilibacter rhizosphaerae]RZS89410.1 shikimate kinase [Motilibacter rhizosphaerae]
MSPVAVLTGPPGAGKTTVGTALATRLDVGFRDTDADVEAGAGRTVAEIFVEDGEPRFRELEAAAVRAALADHDGVLALGGGAILDPATRKVLQDSGSPVVLLEVGVAEAAVRVGFNRERPLLLGNPRQQWSRLLEARLPLYLEVASVRVSTDDREPDQVVDEIVDALQHREIS